MRMIIKCNRYDCEILVFYVIWKIIFYVKDETELIGLVAPRTRYYICYKTLVWCVVDTYLVKTSRLIRFIENSLCDGAYSNKLASSSLNPIYNNWPAHL